MNEANLDVLLRAGLGGDDAVSPEADTAARKRMAAVRRRDDRLGLWAAIMGLLMVFLLTALFSLVVRGFPLIVFACVQLSLLSLSVSFGLLHYKTEEEMCSQ